MNRRIRQLGSRTAYNRYKNNNYKTKRKILKGKTHGYCMLCKHEFPRIDLTIDHKVPVHAGGTHDKENLQLICIGCHVLKNKEEIKVRQKQLGL